MVFILCTEFINILVFGTSRFFFSGFSLKKNKQKNIIHDANAEFNGLCNNQLVDTALLTQFLNEGLLRFVLFPFVNRKKIVIKQEYSKYVILAC